MKAIHQSYVIDTQWVELFAPQFNARMRHYALKCKCGVWIMRSGGLARQARKHAKKAFEKHVESATHLAEAPKLYMRTYAHGIAISSNRNLIEDANHTAS